MKIKTLFDILLAKNHMALDKALKAHEQEPVCVMDNELQLLGGIEAHSFF